MNEFILKEKHKYWDNKITLEEYIKNTEEDGYIDCSSDYEYEFWYILENLKKLNNLQSKIDKAIEYIEKSMNNPQPFYEYLFGDENGKVENLDKLLDILKEDK